MFQCWKVVLWQHFSADVRHSPRRLWTVSDFRESQSLSSSYSICNCLQLSQTSTKGLKNSNLGLTARTRKYYAVSANRIGNSKLQFLHPLALEYLFLAIIRKLQHRAAELYIGAFARSTFIGKNIPFVWVWQVLGKIQISGREMWRFSANSGFI